jgi:hypothetical protein
MSPYIACTAEVCAVQKFATAADTVLLLCGHFSGRASIFYTPAFQGVADGIA